MEFNIYGSGEPQFALSPSIIAQVSQSAQGVYQFLSNDEIAPCCCLTSILEALETFQDFDPDVRAAVIALRAKELGVSQLHFYAIALYAGLGGQR